MVGRVSEELETERAESNLRVPAELQSVPEGVLSRTGLEVDLYRALPEGEVDVHAKVSDTPQMVPRILSIANPCELPN